MKQTSNRVMLAMLRVVAHSSPFRTKDGEVHYAFKDIDELCDEEGNDKYLPRGVSTILEVMKVAAKTQGEGKGTRLMTEFMQQPFVKEADAVYLDMSPNTASLDGNRPIGTEEDILDSLETFYRKFGFRNRYKYSRMWIFHSVKVPTQRLPT